MKVNFLLTFFYKKGNRKQKSRSGSKTGKSQIDLCCSDVALKQMLDIPKMSLLPLRINLPQIFTISGIQLLRKLSEDFQESILGGLILVYNCYSEQPVCNLFKRRTLSPVFSGEIFENGWLWTAISEQSKIAACNVIRFLTTNISFCIIL